MIFEKIFVEKKYQDFPQAIKIIAAFPHSEIRLIDKIEDIFGQVKRPYLQKRTNLNLFIGGKKGQLIKEAPPAYGLFGEPHYYYIHAYNCIYECNYCYLQGHFQSPDIVLFINHLEIAAEIKRTAIEFKNKNIDTSKKIWFHAGEFSDSLALSHLSGELPFYFNLFSEMPWANLELRTKSANIKELKKLTPLPNIITSFSLSPHDRIYKSDLKTPPLKTRLRAMNELYEKGFPIAVHFDPIIYEEKLFDHYQELLDEMSRYFPLEDIKYISIGVVRFTKNVFHQVQKNYPDADFLSDPLTRSFDDKIRYNRPTRNYILKGIKNLLIERNIDSQKIYECMEEG